MISNENNNDNYNLQLLKDIFKIIGYNINTLDDILDIHIEHSFLKKKEIIDELYKLIPKLKIKYNSHKLTCLHINSLEKQKFPAINMIRQILKCNKLKLNPYIVCRGYCNITKKKIIERYFNILVID